MTKISFSGNVKLEMQNYYFILGRENKISQVELQNILASFGFGLKENSFLILSDQVLEIKLNACVDEIAALMNILGGTVKIYQKIASSQVKIVDLLHKENISKKIIFGISNYSKNQFDVFKLALSAKKALKKPMRIIAGKENDQLSSAQSFQYKMDRENIEFGLFDSGWGRLIAVQNIKEWSMHDFGKPKSDAVSGMLPPKLARMMVNIALGSASNEKLEIRDETSSLKPHFLPLVVDPFCGSGNVLIEALTVGCEVIGSDISEKAVLDTKANLEWMSKQLPKFRFNVSKQDATKFDFGSIGRDYVIVTEPYLGKPRKAKLRIEEENQAKEEISKLYLDFLRNLKLTTIDRNLTAICIVFPLFELANGRKLSIFEHCIDFIRDIGYTLVYPPLEYGRDYQVVKRQIVLLKI